jgi:hypothetical protein
MSPLETSRLNYSKVANTPKGQVPRRPHADVTPLVRLSFVAGRLGKDRQVIASAADAHRRRGHAQTTAETSRIAGTLFASLVPGDRITNFLENDGTLKPLSESRATPTAAPQNSMTAAVRRFCSRARREFATINYDVHRWRSQASIKRSKHQKSSFRTRNLTSGLVKVSSFRSSASFLKMAVLVCPRISSRDSLSTFRAKLKSMKTGKH